MVNQHSELLESQYKDPEPLHFALAILATLSGAAGLIIQMAQYRRERNRDRNIIRKHLFIADRSLNRIDEAYRSLISIFDENGILLAPFAPGKSALYADERLRSELNRLQFDIFYGGRDLLNALVELSELLANRDSEIALKIARDLDEIFQKTLHSNRFLEFFIELGRMLELVTEFIYRIGERYGFQPTSIRIGLIDDTISRLKSRIK